MRYRARYSNGMVREFGAKHQAHALKIAQGIARKNQWKLDSVGRI